MPVESYLLEAQDNITLARDMLTDADTPAIRAALSKMANELQEMIEIFTA